MVGEAKGRQGPGPLHPQQLLAQGAEPTAGGARAVPGEQPHPRAPSPHLSCGKQELPQTASTQFSAAGSACTPSPETHIHAGATGKQCHKANPLQRSQTIPAGASGHMMAFLPHRRISFPFERLSFSGICFLQEPRKPRWLELTTGHFRKQNHACLHPVISPWLLHRCCAKNKQNTGRWGTLFSLKMLCHPKRIGQSGQKEEGAKKSTLLPFAASSLSMTEFAEFTNVSKTAGEIQLSR